MEIQLIEEILEQYKDVIGEDLDGYLNHARRMAIFTQRLKECSAEESQKIQIAAAFHDIGLWTGKTVDYIEPSLPPMRHYLSENGLSDWEKEITLMITEHHKIREYKGEYAPLVELFRKGDLIDFSFGTVKFGLDKAFIEEIRAKYPNNNFHKGLFHKWLGWMKKHPLRPGPMMKW